MRAAVLFGLSAFLAVAMGGCPELMPPEDQQPSDTPQDQSPPGETEKTLHEMFFTESFTGGVYTDGSDCLVCHSDRGQQILESAHWNWGGAAHGVAGQDGEFVGKINLINNFCIAIPGNEGRCTQCHPSYGWQDNKFDMQDIDQVDCLVCHSDPQHYSKDPIAAGGGGFPTEASNLQEAAYSVGAPQRANCGKCHYSAGGGDNVKHGDLASSLNDATFEMDVHMGSLDTGGQNYQCQTCHTTTSHRIAGATALHSADEGRVSCTDCHGGTVHESAVLNLHLRSVACQACHIPTYARQIATKLEWYWDEAGEDRTEIPEQFGRATYDKKKGSFVWGKNVRPDLLWYDGQFERVVIGRNDTYEHDPSPGDPVVLARPVGSIDDPKSKLYPFKRFIGRQPADPVNRKLLVPHLFGKKSGENPYWAKFDWQTACMDGDAYAREMLGDETWVDYSGEAPVFVDTVMYLTLNHEIAPASMALDCEACHDGGLDWNALGFDGDPWTNDLR